MSPSSAKRCSLASLSGAARNFGLRCTTDTRAATSTRDSAQSTAESPVITSYSIHYTKLYDIGLHTGDAVVGNVGSSDRMQYSAIGAMINLTSRLEGLNKVYGTRILVSDAIARAVSSYNFV